MSVPAVVMINTLLHVFELVAIVVIGVFLWFLWRQARPLFKLYAFLDLANTDIYKEGQKYKEALEKYKKYLKSQVKKKS